jgi:hypothetical protein
MSCLCNNNIMVGIFYIGFVGSLVAGVECLGLYVQGLEFYSIWDVYGL